MIDDKNKFVVRTKIWIEDSTGKVVFGLGRYKILEAIDRLGSMNLAATELSMSYRAVWCKIRESENRIGRKLVVREGRGSILSPFAKYLIENFNELNQKLQNDADEIFGTLLKTN